MAKKTDKFANGGKKGGDEFDFDSLDSDLDINDDIDYDSSSDKPKGKRQPVMSVSGKDILKDVVSADTLRQIGSKIGTQFSSLDRGYSATIDTISDMDRMRSDVMKDIAPTVNQLKRVSRLYIPKVEGMIPKKLYDKLQNLVKDEDNGNALNKEQAENAVISQNIAEMLSAQQDISNDQYIRNKADDMIRSSEAGSRHTESVTVLSQIRNILKTNQLFFDGIFRKYMVKSIELKYKHLFLTKDMLDTNKLQLEVLTNKLDAIKINTGLPDAIKKHRSEELTELMRKRMYGKVSDSLVDWSSKFRQNLMTNIKTKIFDKFSEGFNEVAGMLAEGAETHHEMGEMDAEMGVKKKSPLTKLSSMIIKKLLVDTGLISIKAGVGVQNIKDLDSLVKEVSAQIPYRVNDYVQSRDDAIGDILRNLVPMLEKERGSVENTFDTQGGEEATFDVVARRSLVEIIPGLLSKIHQQSSVIAKIVGFQTKRGMTKDQASRFDKSIETEELVFDRKSEDFVGVAEFKQRTMTDLFGTKESRTDDMQPIIDQMYADYKRKGGDKDVFKDSLPDIVKFVTNITKHAQLVPFAKILKYLKGDVDLTDAESEYMEYVLKDIPDDARVKLASLLATTFFKDLGTEKEGVDKDAANAIGPMLRRMAEQKDEFVKKLPEINVYGGKRFYDDILAAESDEAIKREIKKLRAKYVKQYTAKKFDNSPELQVKFNSEVKLLHEQKGLQHDKVRAIQGDVDHGRLLEGIDDRAEVTNATVNKREEARAKIRDNNRPEDVKDRVVDALSDEVDKDLKKVKGWVKTMFPSLFKDTDDQISEFGPKTKEEMDKATTDSGIPNHDSVKIAGPGLYLQGVKHEAHIPLPSLKDAKKTITDAKDKLFAGAKDKYDDVMGSTTVFDAEFKARGLAKRAGATTRRYRKDATDFLMEKLEKLTSSLDKAADGSISYSKTLDTLSKSVGTKLTNMLSGISKFTTNVSGETSKLFEQLSTPEGRFALGFDTEVAIKGGIKRAKATALGYKKDATTLIPEKLEQLSKSLDSVTKKSTEYSKTLTTMKDSLIGGLTKTAANVKKKATDTYDDFIHSDTALDLDWKRRELAQQAKSAMLNTKNAASDYLEKSGAKELLGEMKALLTKQTEIFTGKMTGPGGAIERGKGVLGQVGSHVGAMAGGVSDFISNKFSSRSPLKSIARAVENIEMMLAKQFKMEDMVTSSRKNAATEEKSDDSKLPLWARAVKAPFTLAGKGIGLGGKAIAGYYGAVGHVYKGIAQIGKDLIPKAISKALPQLGKAVEVAGGLLKGGAETYLKFLGWYYKGVKSVIPFIGKKIGQGLKFLFVDREKYSDVYRKDAIEVGKPLLKGKSVEEGKYIFADGSLVKASNKIHGPVFDGETQQALVTMDDIKHGLVNAQNEPFSGGSIMGALAKKGLKLAGKVIGGIGRGIGHVAKGVWHGANYVADKTLNVAGHVGGGVIRGVGAAFGADTSKWFKSKGATAAAGMIGTDQLKSGVTNHLITMTSLLKSIDSKTAGRRGKLQEDNGATAAKNKTKAALGLLGGEDGGSSDQPKPPEEHGMWDSVKGYVGGATASYVTAKGKQLWNLGKSGVKYVGKGISSAARSPLVDEAVGYVGNGIKSALPEIEGISKLGAVEGILSKIPYAGAATGLLSKFATPLVVADTVRRAYNDANDPNAADKRLSDYNEQMDKGSLGSKAWTIAENVLNPYNGVTLATSQLQRAIGSVSGPSSDSVSGPSSELGTTQVMRYIDKLFNGESGSDEKAKLANAKNAVSPYLHPDYNNNAAARNTAPNGPDGKPITPGSKIGTGSIATPVTSPTSDLALKYETGTMNKTKASRKISTGKGDHGGKSYGAYQIESAEGGLTRFIATSGYGEQFAGLTPGSPDFDAKWQEIADKDPAFFDAQRNFTKDANITPMISSLTKKGFDLTSRGEAVKQMLFSTGNQYGPSIGLGVISKALKDGLKPGHKLEDLSDEELITMIQDYKAANVATNFKSSPELQPSLAKRAGVDEKADLLAMNKSLQAAAPTETGTPSASATPVASTGSSLAPNSVFTNPVSSNPAFNTAAVPAMASVSNAMATPPITSTATPSVADNKQELSLLTDQNAILNQIASILGGINKNTAPDGTPKPSPDANKADNTGLISKMDSLIDTMMKSGPSQSVASNASLPGQSSSSSENPITFPSNQDSGISVKRQTVS